MPHQGELQAFTKNGVIIKDGQTIDCDLVVLSLGSGSPTFPFCLKNIATLESEPDGVQLYRLLHPDIPGWRLQALTMALCTFRRLKSACCGCLRYSP